MMHLLSSRRVVSAEDCALCTRLKNFLLYMIRVINLHFTDFILKEVRTVVHHLLLSHKISFVLIPFLVKEYFMK